MKLMTALLTHREKRQRGRLGGRLDQMAWMARILPRSRPSRQPQATQHTLWLADCQFTPTSSAFRGSIWSIWDSKTNPLLNKGFCWPRWDRKHPGQVWANAPSGPLGAGWLFPTARLFSTLTSPSGPIAGSSGPEGAPSGPHDQPLNPMFQDSADGCHGVMKPRTLSPLTRQRSGRQPRSFMHAVMRR